MYYKPGVIIVDMTCTYISSPLFQSHVRPREADVPAEPVGALLLRRLRRGSDVTGRQPRHQTVQAD